jgi:hypothetical protein
MSATARVSTFTFFPELTAQIEARTIRALEAAAATGKAVAEERANTPKPIAHFETVEVHSIGDGYASGLRAGPLTRIFDKGSLGQHTGELKRGRTPSWETSRGSNPYTAHRSDDLSGKGVSPRRIINPARLAGRKALIAGIRGH